MDGKHFSLITISMIILLGIVGLGFMQMNTNNSLDMISNRLATIEKRVAQESSTVIPTGSVDGDVTWYVPDSEHVFPEFAYPKGFTEALIYRDDGSYSAEYGGPKDLFITSQPGRLVFFRSASSVATGAEFTDGIQFEFRRVVHGAGYYSEQVELRNTKNPKAKEIVNAKERQILDCSKGECPLREFFITTNDRNYEMRVSASKSYQFVDRDIKMIINSIK